jgi:hypothetical protein
VSTGRRSCRLRRGSGTSCRVRVRVLGVGEFGYVRSIGSIGCHRMQDFYQVWRCPFPRWVDPNSLECQENPGGVIFVSVPTGNVQRQSYRPIDSTAWYAFHRPIRLLAHRSEEHEGRSLDTLRALTLSILSQYPPVMPTEHADQVAATGARSWRRPHSYWVLPFILCTTFNLGLTTPSRAEIVLDVACMAHPPQPSGSSTGWGPATVPIDPDQCKRDSGVQSAVIRLTTRAFHQGQC